MRDLLSDFGLYEDRLGSGSGVVSDVKQPGSDPAYNPPSRKSIPPFEALRAFDAVARLGGVRRAARALGRDHAVISRHLKTLELWTGAKLVERSPSSVNLTEEGRRYHRDIATAMDFIATSTINLMRRHHNHLHISCAPAFALHWMSHHLVEFERRNPDVQIELRPTDRRPEGSGYEADIELRFVPSYRVLESPDVGWRSQEVAMCPIVAVASPDYLAKNPRIEKPADLVGHRLLHEHDFDSWAHWLAAHEVHDELDLTGPRLWQGHLTLDAALRDRGVALINVLVAGAFLETGALVEVGKDLASFQPHLQGRYMVLSRTDRWNAPLIQRFRRWLAGELGKERLPSSGA